MWVDLQCNKEKMVLSPKLSALWILKYAFKTELICENDVQLQIIWLRLRKMKRWMMQVLKTLSFKPKRAGENLNEFGLHNPYAEGLWVE